MKTILVPTDFSDTANKALNIAKELARKTNAKLHIAHFYSIPITDYAHPEISIPDKILEEIKSASKEGINKLVAQLKEEGFNVGSTIEMGMVTDEIVALAKKIDADLIIMGTTGGSGVFINKLIGSNASNVMQQTEKPIMLVPKDYVFEGIKDIAYADSLHEDDTDILKQVFVFADAVGATDVDILNINTTSAFEPASEKLVEHLKEVFPEAKFDFVDANSVQEGIDKYLEDHSIDLVVMYRHKKSLMERIFSKSNTKMMALHTKVPLMVYHK